ncbi:unnamed protein product [Parnassius apollo]|uniref:(apollo) hypothetical protein n=1 Tax=Parnassius apollo TaxID=110799 RepID=A0A8S3Y7A9_PARAO|nr:unnamed protein product [Parnassius apollo]
MQREKLIEEVRKYPYLYDLSDAKYSNSIKKDEAWKQISITLKQSESECKKTWLNLRESHRRAMKKRKTKSGQAAPTTKKWTFEDEMSFLVPHYKERNTISSVDYDDDSDVSLVSEMELKEIAEKQSYYSYRNPYIPQREDDMPRGYTTLNNISHEIQSTSGASNIDDFNMSNLEENGTSNADDLNTSNIL